MLEVLAEREGIEELEVVAEGRLEKAINYPQLTGRAAVGDRVRLNTTAVRLGLGTGGYHFVTRIEMRKPRDPEEGGHIMKLRYTPWQLRCQTVEEEGGPLHDGVAACAGLDGMPVICLSLHSQLAPAAAGAALGDNLRIAYIMTDGGALPLWFSRTVRELRGTGLIEKVFTCGHAFGGEETVTLFSALAAAHAAGCDLAIVGMGPGVVGTGTRWGTTALEQGVAVNAAAAMGGRPVAALRLSFADPRPRHRGISHHCLTALGTVALARADVCLPPLPEERMAIVWNQLVGSGIASRHRLVIEDGSAGVAALLAGGVKLETMARGPGEEPEFFLAAAAAGRHAGRLARGSRLPLKEAGLTAGTGAGRLEGAESQGEPGPERDSVQVKGWGGGQGAGPEPAPEVSNGAGEIHAAFGKCDVHIAPPG